MKFYLKMTRFLTEFSMNKTTLNFFFTMTKWIFTKVPSKLFYYNQIPSKYSFKSKIFTVCDGIFELGPPTKHLHFDKWLCTCMHVCAHTHNLWTFPHSLLINEKKNYSLSIRIICTKKDNGWKTSSANYFQYWEIKNREISLLSIAWDSFLSLPEK